MFCCDDLTDATERDLIVKASPDKLRDGRVVNEIDSEYFLRSGEGQGGYRYLAFNYCPFCGHGLSRGLWRAEKKK